MSKQDEWKGLVLMKNIKDTLVEDLTVMILIGRRFEIEALYLVGDIRLDGDSATILGGQ
jgi:hypothetical protein